MRTRNDRLWRTQQPKNPSRGWRGIHRSAPNTRGLASQAHVTLHRRRFFENSLYGLKMLTEYILGATSVAPAPQSHVQCSFFAVVVDASFNLSLSRKTAIFTRLSWHVTRPLCRTKLTTPRYAVFFSSFLYIYVCDDFFFKFCFRNF